MWLISLNLPIGGEQVWLRVFLVSLSPHSTLRELSCSLSNSLEVLQSPVPLEFFLPRQTLERVNFCQTHLVNSSNRLKIFIFLFQLDVRFASWAVVFIFCDVFCFVVDVAPSAINGGMFLGVFMISRGVLIVIAYMHLVPCVGEAQAYDGPIWDAESPMESVVFCLT